MTDDGSRTHSPKRLLIERGLRPRKRFGQNFLVDPRFAQAVAAALPASAFVVEIGAGTGSLTAALAAHARKVVALEIDRDLVAILRKRFDDESGVTIVEHDALRFDLRAALAAERPPRAVCGNLPYNITTPLIEEALDAIDAWEAAVFMVQREYAKRLVAAAGTPEYGSLTLFVSYFCRVEKLFDIGAAGFYPAPDVASAVIRLTPKGSRDAAVTDERLLLTTIRAAFAQRRKTLSNCIAAASPSARRERIDAAIRDAGLDPGIRGERLTLDDFRRLTAAFSAAGIHPGAGERGRQL